jgi:hypothetical protein
VHVKAVIAETAETVKPMMRASEWLEDKRRRDSALRIADDLGISDIEATSRYRPHAAPRQPSFVAMMIVEWHKLVADVSRVFARRRIHRAAESRRARAHVKLPQTSNNKLAN